MVYINTDAVVVFLMSDFAVGACLYQIKDEQQRLIAYQFKKLSESEKRYEVHDKELLAIVKVLQD